MIALRLLLLFSSVAFCTAPAPYADAQHGLALKILKSKENVNIVYSPFSIFAGFGMAFDGASGETKSEIHRIILRSLPPHRLDMQFQYTTSFYRINHESGCSLHQAFRLYYEKSYPVFANFTYKLQTYFQSQILPVDFANQASTIRQQINSWVEEETKNKIKNLIPEGSLDSMTKLVLVNALYFKGFWKTQFNTANTESETFYSSPTKNNKVDMMRSFGVDDYYYYENSDLQILGMPYLEEDLKLAMYIILPKDRFGLNALEKKLNDSCWELLSKAESTKMADVKIPKFQIEKQIDLKAIFESYGIKKMFNQNEADFSAISGQKNLFVSDMYHKAFIQVTEYGTEAAAATTVHISTVMLPNKNFIVDHPFLFTIVDRKTYFPLFYGRIVEP